MIQELFIGTIAYSTPLLLAALGGYFSERAGTVNIALEGKMLIGAFFSVAGVWYTDNVFVGILCAVVFGALTGLLHGVLTVYCKCDDIISGIAINILALGITGYGLHVVFGRSGSTPGVRSIGGGPLQIPWLFFTGIFLVIVTHYWSGKTRSGLRHRAVGESIRATIAAGVEPKKIKVIGATMAGVLAAIGGAQLSVGELGSFVERMTAGNGFIALAVLILSRWKPLPLIITSLFFGFARAFSESLELMIPSLPSDLILMIPFIITIIVMGGLGKQTVVPGALGKKIA